MAREKSVALVVLDWAGTTVDFGCFAPAFADARWLERFAFLEKAGERWWKVLGGVYVVRAVKRVHGMRLIAPAWRKERARRRALAPIPQRNGSARQRHD